MTFAFIKSFYASLLGSKLTLSLAGNLFLKFSNNASQNPFTLANVWNWIHHIAKRLYQCAEPLGVIHFLSSSQRDWSEENGGKVLYESLKILDLGYRSSIAEAKAQYRSFARIYHPDQYHHHCDEIGMSDAKATHVLRLVKDAYEYFCTKL